ncbi:hypothetical protein IWQ57_003323 [Coemansia nantahalensis]|uniref:Uncharacterized protein n=1 Tax=Coemansia nantahalensis TaxID=2789366 RepID=A0ACC1JWZ4_9FUNG|nr:hypothetical protein IWQ57_003323 [Coemansia nantahalensis]
MRTIQSIALLTAALAAQLGAMAADAPAPPQLKCRTEPGPAGLLAKAYANGVAIGIECQTPGSTVGNATAWHRTSDGCYVSARFVDVSGLAGAEPQCADIDGARPCRTIAAAGVALIKQFEGFIAKPRADITGLPTIGFGHQCASTNCTETGFSFPFTRDEAHVLLLRDIAGATQCLAGALAASVVLDANQWAALASWTLNVGCTMAARSQLVARLNRGEPPAATAAQQLPRWRIFRGRRVPELVSRRAAELALFATKAPRAAFPRCGAAIA